jgi:hypothetical protein
MTFLQACVDAARKAKDKGVVFYVYEAPTMWHITPNYHRHSWLFRAYPGGRKEMSEAGARLAEAEGVNVRESEPK